MTQTLKATHLRGYLWVVRPKGQLGTCGFHPVRWTVVYVEAPTAELAIKKASQPKRPPRRRT